MNIFIQIKNSIYNKEYYKNTVLSETMSESMKYLAKICLLLALVGVVIFSFSMPKFSRIIKNGVSTFATDYPSDLIFSIKDGNASVNRPSPYIVKMPGSLISKDYDPKGINNFIVVDTESPFNINKFNEYETIGLVTKTELIVMQSENGKLEILPLSKFGNVDITKSWVLDKENLFFSKILPWVTVLVFPLIFIGIFVGSFVGSLIMLFLYALIVWIILKIKKMDFSYRRSYQVAIHALTIILILGLLARYLSTLNNFYIKILILILIVLLNFGNKTNQTKEESVIVIPEKIEG